MKTMPNKTINDDNVKWRSKKKYPCKRNKGEHEWGEPTIKHEPRVRYIYNEGSVDSPNPPDKYSDIEELKFSHAEISLLLETRCIHCGKKVLTYLEDKLK